MANRSIVFSIPEYDFLRDALCERADLEPGILDVRYFPDDERYMRIVSPVSGRDVVLVGGTISDTASLTLYDLAYALVKDNARRLSILIPYYGYGTMERAARSGEVVTAKTRAHLFSSLPAASFGTRIVLLDLHAEGICHYFEGGIITQHVTAAPLVIDAARRLGGDDFVLGCTDAGRAKWVQTLANSLRVDAAFVYKRRVDDSTTEVTAVNARVAGKRVVIYDDMIRTGSSLVGAARAYLEAGAESVVSIATHGLFPGDAWPRLRDCGLLSHVVCTNSHPRTTEVARGCQAGAPVCSGRGNPPASPAPSSVLSSADAPSQAAPLGASQPSCTLEVMPVEPVFVPWVSDLRDAR